MNDYTKGILTGASLILCFFMFVGANRQLEDAYHKDIYASSIKILGEKGSVFINSEGIAISSNDSGKVKIKTILSTDDNGAGSIFLYNKNKKNIVNFASNDDGSGRIGINSHEGKRVVVASAVSQKGGAVVTYDNQENASVAITTDESGYGSIGVGDGEGDLTALLTNSELQFYNSEGSQILNLGISKTQDGYITLFNKKHEPVVILAVVDNDGALALYDRYGDVGWAESGKK